MNKIKFNQASKNSDFKAIKSIFLQRQQDFSDETLWKLIRRPSNLSRFFLFSNIMYIIEYHEENLKIL